MRRSAFFLAVLLWLPSSASAARWLENDYTFGSNGMKKDSMSFFTGVSRRVTIGAGAAFFRNNIGRKMIYSYRLPVMYSGQGEFVSLTPFVYPVDGKMRSGAYGGKLDLVTSLTPPEDDNYLHVTLSGAWARQKATVLGAAGPAEFSQTAGQLQVEKSFYRQFIFLLSGTGFSSPAGVNNRTLQNPALDLADMAYTGTFARVTALPEWIMSAQMARNMKPEYNSYLYAGYSKISLRHADRVSSLQAGIKIGLNDTTTLDLAVNPYKPENGGWKSYYKLLFKLYFVPERE